MKRKAALSALLALVVAAPAVIAPSVAPSLAPQAQAQAEYPDVPLDHWAYNAINKLSQAGIIEGYPNGTYSGNRAMTRYEFAVAIARLLQNIGGPGKDGAPGAPGAPGAAGTAGATGPQGPPGPMRDDVVLRPELQDALAQLTNEFRTELRALGVRVDDLENRVTALENRVVKPPRMTISASLLHRTGGANYIDNDDGGRTGSFTGGFGGGNGAGVGAFFAPGGNGAFDEAFDLDEADDDDRSKGSKKFSYTDFELRLTDRVTDQLSVNAALRAITGTQEDPWLFDDGDDARPTDAFNLREANVVADLGNRLGAKNMTLILGRQRTKIAQGLLYDNDLFPTDQLHAMFNVGPIALGAFIGSSNNNNVLGDADRANPYIGAGAVQYLGDSGFNPGNTFGGDNNAIGSGAGVGFPFETGLVDRTDDNELAVHGAINLFRIAGQPVALGGTYMADGVGDQKGWGADLTIPLFNRNVGIEYVAQEQYANGASSDGRAFNITVPVLRLNKLDLDVAYGRANDEFEYFITSSANPFARTYGEAVFDRPIALGAPLVNGDGEAGDPQFMAAKRVFDVNGTLRLLKRLPLQFRYYTAKGTDGRDLGHVWSVGSTLNLTQGLDLELKYGQYNPDGDFENIKYFRVGANVGF